jgi:hypothetical protein
VSLCLVVSDFGMSVLLERGQTVGYAESAFGPVCWMSPEAFCCEYSRASDVYVVALLLV